MINDITNIYSSTHWKDSIEIEILDLDATELEILDPVIPKWKLYVTNLKLSRIVLSLEEEKFIWFGGSQQGMVFFQEIYRIITQLAKHI